jgi:predicted nucleic acid-binding protein
VTRYLLDRDVLSALEDPRGNRNVHAWSDTVPDDALHVGAVTVMEARKGFAKMRAKARSDAERAEVEGYEASFAELLDAFAERLLPLDRVAAERWGEMLARREVHVMDAALAAIAAVHGLVVATRNLRHFRGRGVRLIDPFQPRPMVEEPVA